jgi:hypothetical protein
MEVVERYQLDVLQVALEGWAEGGGAEEQEEREARE